MITSSDDLDMMQLSDSFFPTGLFTNSNGIESMFLANKITTADELEDLCRMFVIQQIGPCDCVALANAYDSAESSDLQGILDADAACVSYKTIKETRDAAVRSGVQLTRCVKEFHHSMILDWYHNKIQDHTISGIYPVSLGVCAMSLGIKKPKAILVLLYGFVTSSVGAALRLGIIQHFEAQQIIHRLKPSILYAAESSFSMGLDQMWQFAPQTEIYQMRHERLDSKMFIT